MKGSAPKSPATGSHVDVRQNCSPNFSIERIDWRASSKPMAATIRISNRPNAPVATLKPRSLRIPSDDLYSLERREFLFDQIRRQRRVPKLGRELLPVAERPTHEVDHCLRLRLVGRILVQKKPRERGDGV